jgi:hypothetical protein
MSYSPCSTGHSFIRHRKHSVISSSGHIIRLYMTLQSQKTRSKLSTLTRSSNHQPSLPLFWRSSLSSKSLLHLVLHLLCYVELVIVPFKSELCFICCRSNVLPSFIYPRLERIYQIPHCSSDYQFSWLFPMVVVCFAIPRVLGAIVFKS